MNDSLYGTPNACSRRPFERVSGRATVLRRARRDRSLARPSSKHLEGSCRGSTGRGRGTYRPCQDYSCTTRPSPDALPAALSAYESSDAEKGSEECEEWRGRGGEAHRGRSRGRVEGVREDVG